MRRMVLVCFTVLLSAGLASIVTFSVSAQTASEEQYSGGETPSEAPPPSGPLPGGDESPKDAGSRQPATEGSQARATASEDAARTPAGGTSAGRSSDGEARSLPHSRPPGQKGGPTFTGTIPKDPYYQVVDAAGAADAADSFRFEIPTTRHYSVWAWWEPSEDNASAALFEVPTTSGVGSDVVDQRVDSGFWVLIGVFEMREGARTVRLEDGRGTGRATAEQVMVVGDAAAAPSGETASFADPNTLEPVPADAAGGGDTAFSAQRVGRDPSRGDVVRIARRHKGTRYGNNRCVAFRQEDCSCLTRLVYKKVGVGLRDSPVFQWRASRGVNYKQRSKVRAGHLVFHDLNRDGNLDDHYADHVGIYAGNGKEIHASSYFGRVVVSDMKYLDGFWGGKRFRL